MFLDFIAIFYGCLLDNWPSEFFPFTKQDHWLSKSLAPYHTRYNKSNQYVEENVFQCSSHNTSIQVYQNFCRLCVKTWLTFYEYMIYAMRPGHHVFSFTLEMKFSSAKTLWYSWQSMLSLSRLSLLIFSWTTI